MVNKVFYEFTHGDFSRTIMVMEGKSIFRVSVLLRVKHCSFNEGSDLV